MAKPWGVPDAPSFSLGVPAGVRPQHAMATRAPSWPRHIAGILAKRKPQRLLAPAFVASVTIGGDDPQGLIFVLAATEEPFVSFDAAALEAPLVRARRTPGPMRD